MKKCETCQREFNSLAGTIFIPNKENYLGIPRGVSIFVCKECFMCYLAQDMDMNNKEITDWVNLWENFNKNKELYWI